MNELLDDWRTIPIDTVNCSRAIFACRDLSEEIERLERENADLRDFMRGVARQIDKRVWG